MISTPVALFVYNRVETAAQVLARIAEARPPRLLLVADGPRRDVIGDEARCAAVRELVRGPGWDCEVIENFSNENLGLGRRFSSGLNWVFQTVEEAIILEDDCLPDPTFFAFCEELLAHFRFDDRVMMISGDNYQFGRDRGSSSYFASNCVGTYGWATWRRAFAYYDFQMKGWPVERNSDLLRRIWPSNAIADYWARCFDGTHSGSIDTWDFQWAYAMWRNRGLQISPNVNLVKYIGCLPDAVHTVDPNAPYCDIPASPMRFPLVHPENLERNLGADIYEFHRIFLSQSHEHALAAELLATEEDESSTDGG